MYTGGPCFKFGGVKTSVCSKFFEVSPEGFFGDVQSVFHGVDGVCLGGE